MRRHQESDVLHMTALQYLRWMYRWNRPRLSVYRAALEALRSLRTPF